jgi:2'-5' RNA ligase
MALADLPLGANAEAVRDHWWWRPGWRVGRSFYTWHINFDGANELHTLAARYRAVLADLPGITLVPDRWLHLTMQGVGFTDEVGHDDVSAITEAAGKRLALLSPVTVQFGPAVIGDEAVALPAQPDGAVRAIRAAIRSAIGDVWGADAVPEEADRFRPHASVAYLGKEGPAAPYVEAVSHVGDGAARTPIRAASLIRLHRDRRMYEWDTLATVPLSRA